MSFLYKTFISPIEMIVDMIFSFVINEMPQLGVFTAILIVSLCINFFALPLYNIADNLQEKERKIRKKLEFRVKAIRKSFSGDERFMMLSEYYRQNNYLPLYALRSALSILIEIPFFIAAYHYLSNCQTLRDASFWIFKDLGAPDNLFSFTINNILIPINILPIVMTLINFVSGAIYTKSAPLSEKIQLYVVALIFLVLLYNSPSGLVLYWILNNIFSLLKNAISKTKHPKKILHICVSVLLVCATCICSILLPFSTLIGKILLGLLTVIVIFLPQEYRFLYQKFPSLAELNEKSENTSSFQELSKNYFWTFFISTLALALLTGFLLPSNVVVSSTKDFCFLGQTESPLSYISASFFLFLGLFVIWPLCIYKMFGKKIRKSLAIIFFTALICSLANVFIFKHPYGEIENTFILNHPEIFNNLNLFYTLLPLFAILLAALILYLAKKYNKIGILNFFLIVICLAETSTAIYNTAKIKKEFNSYKNERIQNNIYTKDSKNPQNGKTDFEQIFNISQNGTNVVVIFLDRAISSFFPHIIEEFPELKDDYKGFTFYPNTLSFGNYTLLGAPSLLGGYEYTPEKINERKDELLRKKHNEASLVMPTLFKNAGFNVLVTDPPFPNFTWKGDLSKFTKKGINAIEIAGKYRKNYESEINAEIVMTDKICRTGMQYFSIIQIIYPPLRGLIYNGIAHFLSDGFNNVYSSLYYMKDLTKISSSAQNNFILIDNETPHTQAFLNIPEYDKQISYQDTDIESRKFKTSSNIEEMHYDVNVAAIKKIGEWLKFLQENKAYDNTRIIIVSDHGRDFKTQAFENFKDSSIPTFFNPLLLVKDFNSSDELKTDFSFMTNADTIFFAKQGIKNISDKNPYTKKTFVQDKKESVHIYEIQNSEWNCDNILVNKTFTLKPEKSWIVKENIFDPKNWKKGENQTK